MAPSCFKSMTSLCTLMRWAASKVELGLKLGVCIRTFARLYIFILFFLLCLWSLTMWGFWHETRAERGNKIT